MAMKKPNASAPKTRTRIVKVPITISMKEVEVERRRERSPQCCEPFAGRTSIRFCERRLHHEGDHRASGVQWQTVEVPMTPADEKKQRRAVAGIISHLVGRMSEKRGKTGTEDT